MSELSFLWLFLNLFSIALLAFFSMSEMACVSFNKIRLQYYVGTGDPRANQLNILLKNPSHLFGATLIGVNLALVFGSEFSRQFYESIGINPDFAPLTQVLLVVIFGELAPMFAARRYSEHVALLAIPFLYIWSKWMTPVLWLIEQMTKMVQVLLGKSSREENFYISKEELMSLISETEEEGPTGSPQALNTIVSNLFVLRNKTAEQVMIPLSSSLLIPSTCTVGELRELMKKSFHESIPMFHRIRENIIGIAFPRDLLRETESQKVKEKVRAPWFIVQKTPILQILQQFRLRPRTVAIVLNDLGKAVGVLSLEDIVDEIFGSEAMSIEVSPAVAKENLFLIERSLPGDMRIADFNKLYPKKLDPQGCETFAELIVKNLGHYPEENESIYIPPFEILVKEVSFLEIKTILIKTRVS